MRYYHLTILNTTTTKSEQNNTLSVHRGKGNLSFFSYVRKNPNGSGYTAGSPTDKFDPGALDIQFQITETSLTTFDTSAGGVAITIQGVDITTINQASNLRGRTVSLQAGMGVGLPLSNPTQTGEILRGTVLSSVGNWSETDLSLTIYVIPYIVPPERWGIAIAPELTPTDTQPVDNLQFHCQKGADLLEATKVALNHAATNYKVTTQITGPIPCPRDILGIYHSLKDLCIGIGRVWRETTGKDVFISIKGQSFSLATADNTSTPVKIKFEELMGQPTWNGPVDMTFTTAMRGDICVGDLVELPNIGQGGLILAQSEAAIFATRNHSLFAGVYRVRTITHLGQFRSPDGFQWASTFTCYPNEKKAS